MESARNALHKFGLMEHQPYSPVTGTPTVGRVHVLVQQAIRETFVSPWLAGACSIYDTVYSCSGLQQYCDNTIRVLRQLLKHFFRFNGSDTLDNERDSRVLRELRPSVQEWVQHCWKQYPQRDRLLLASLIIPLVKVLVEIEVQPRSALLFAQDLYDTLLLYTSAANPATVQAMEDLGSVNYHIGDHTGNVAMARAFLSVLQSEGVPDGADAAVKAALLLANALRNSDQPNLALEQLKRLKATEVSEKLHVRLWNGLAAAYLLVSDHANAADATERLLKVEGPTTTAMSTLALLFFRRGRFEDALKINRRVWEFNKDQPWNTAVAATALQLAVTLNMLRQHSEAEKLLRTVVELCPPQLATLHLAKLSLASVLTWRRTEVEEALMLAKDTIAWAKQTGNDGLHAKAVTTLAHVLHVLQRPEALAHTLRAQSLMKQSSSNGRCDPDYFAVCGPLADLLQFHQKHEEAFSWRKEVASSLKAFYHPNHHEVCTAMRNLAKSYSTEARYHRALHLLLKAAGRSWNRPQTALDCWIDAGVAYRRLGMYGKAKAIQESTLRVVETMYRTTHAKVLRARHNLAVTLLFLQEYGMAGQLFRRVLKERKEELTNAHPDTQNTAANLVMCLVQTATLADDLSKADAILTEAETLTTSATNVQTMLADARSRLIHLVASRDAILARRYHKDPSTTLTEQLELMHACAYEGFHGAAARWAHRVQQRCSDGSEAHTHSTRVLARTRNMKAPLLLLKPASGSSSSGGAAAGSDVQGVGAVDVADDADMDAHVIKTFADVGAAAELRAAAKLVPDFLDADLADDIDNIEVHKTGYVLDAKLDNGVWVQGVVTNYANDSCLGVDYVQISILNDAESYGCGPRGTEFIKIGAGRLAMLGTRAGVPHHKFVAMHVNRVLCRWVAAALVALIQSL